MDPDLMSDGALLQTHQATAKNYAKFYPKWVRNNFLSEKEGAEVGKHEDFVMIICPGQPKSEFHSKATEDHKREHPQEWAAYIAGKEQRLSGTPIDLLPGLERGRADSLKAIYIHSIEQLAEANETAKHNIGMGAGDLVQRAKAYLQKNSAEVAALKEQLAQKDVQLQEQQAQIAALSERMAALESPQPGKPRRPRAERVTQ